MSDAAGSLVSLQSDDTIIVVPDDVDITFFPGGKVAVGALQNNDGSKTRQVKKVGGIVKGITSRLTKNKSIQAMVDMIVKSADEDLPLIFELANGDKYSGAVFFVATEDFFTNQEGKGAMEVHATNGKFNLVS